MKHIFIIILMQMALTVFSQSEKYIGHYSFKSESDDGIVIEYDLTLHSDGRFLFHFFQDQLCYTDDLKGKGKWRIIDSKLIFSANEKNDIDEDYTLNLNNTKATVLNGVLKLYDCEIEWLNNTELTKLNEKNN